jgi:hypothetical protein
MLFSLGRNPGVSLGRDPGTRLGRLLAENLGRVGRLDLYPFLQCQQFLYLVVRVLLWYHCRQERLKIKMRVYFAVLAPLSHEERVKVMWKIQCCMGCRLYLCLYIDI